MADEQRNGGIDILKLAAATKESLNLEPAHEKPPQNIILDIDSKPKKKREKKTLLLRRKDEENANHSVKKMVNKNASTDKAAPSETRGIGPMKSGVQHEPTSDKDKAASTDGPSVMILKRDNVNKPPPNKSKMCDLKNTPKKKDTTKPSKKNGGKNFTQQQQEELCSLKRKLELEKSARKLCEATCQKAQGELRLIRETLEHETLFRKNVQRDLEVLKEELENKRTLREKAKTVESKFNSMISEKQSTIKDLEAQLCHEKQAKESIILELEGFKSQFLSEKNTCQLLREELAESHKVNSGLQEKMGAESAAAISTKMELHSMKSRMSKVEEVEQALKQEIFKVNMLQNELAKAESFRVELEEAKEQLSRIDSLKMELLLEKSRVHDLKANLEDQKCSRKRSESNDVATRNTRSQSISSTKYEDLDDVEIHVERMRKELHDTREALKSERKKNAALLSKKTKTAEVSSLKDYIDLVLPSTAEVNMPPATQISLSDGPTQEKTTKRLMSEQPKPIEPHYFDGTTNEFCGEEETSQLELIFIMSAYSSEEILVSDNKDTITYIIDLPSNNEEEVVRIKVVVHIPTGYPVKGMLSIDVGISDEANCSSEMRKCLVDTLPKLCQICSWEAEASYGQEALFAVFNIADGWAQTEWPGILSKNFPCFKILQRPKEKDLKQPTDMYSALIFTHHLIESDKLQLLKKITSKLGGFIKSGKPGVILLQSISESGCDLMMDELKSHSSQKIFRSNTFKLAGKVARQEDVKSPMRKMTVLENSKDGMDELIRACDILGLADILKEII